MQKRLEALKNELGLTITDMAELFGVARPSIYAWLKGQEPQHQYLKRLIELESYAEQVADLGLSRVDKLIKRPLKSGFSLFALIKSGEPAEQALMELSNIATVEQGQRITPKGGTVLWTAREVADHDTPDSVIQDT